MTCSEFTEFLDAFVDGDLSPAEAAEFERHLEACKHCVAYLDTYRKAMAAGKKVFDDPCDDVPPDVPEDLVQAILASRKR